MIRIGNLKLSLDEREELLTKKAARALNISPHDIRDLHITKKAVDARDKTNVHFVFSVDVSVAGDEKKILSRIRRGDITLKPRDEDMMLQTRLRSSLCLISAIQTILMSMMAVWRGLNHL